MSWIDPNVRLASLLVSVAVGVFVAFAWGGRGSDPHLESRLQALELEVEHQGRVETVRVPLPVTIGRSPTSTLLISDSRVSRMHARIDQRDGMICLRDLGSRNGTLLNARPIEGSVELSRGDEIDVGLARIRVGEVQPWT